jgi:hypothetical protein
MWPAVLKAPKTTAFGAGNLLAMVRGSGLIGVGTGSSFRFQFIQVIAETVETAFPFRAAGVDPGFNLTERFRLDAAGTGSSDLAGDDQAGTFQDRKMLQHRRQGHPERSGKVADGPRSAGQFFDHRSACWIGEGMEGKIDRGLMVKHIL